MDLRASLTSLASAFVFCVLVATSVPIPWTIRLGIVAVGGLLLPLAADFSSRILILLLAFTGTALLLWLVPSPSVGVAHGALAAAVVGGAIGFVIGRNRPGVALGPARPQLAPVDLLPLFACLATISFMWRPFTVSDPGAALALTIPSRDNSPHLYITALLHDHGTLQPFLGTSFDGSEWGYGGYPSGFHATVATIIDMMGPLGADRTEFLIAFWHATAVVTVLVVTASVAAVTALPALRAQPRIAAIASAAVLSTYLWGPGLLPLADGHLNVPLAILGVAAVLSSVLSSSGGTSVRRVLLSVLGILTAAGAWAPLGIVAASGLLLVVLPWRSRVEPSRGRSTWVSLGLLLTCAAALAMIERWATVGVTDSFLVTANSPLKSVPAIVIGISFVAVVATTVLTGVSARRASTDQRAQRSLATRASIVPLTAFALLAILGGQQLASSGELRYYAIKLAVMATTVGLLYVCSAFAVICALRRTGGGRRGDRRWWVALVSAVILQFAFGNPVPELARRFPPAIAYPTRVALGSRTGQATLAAALSAAGQASHDQHAYILTSSLGGPTCARYTMAVEAARGIYTVMSAQLIDEFVATGDLARSAAEILRADRTGIILTDSRTRPQIVAHLGADEGARVLLFNA